MQAQSSGVKQDGLSYYGKTGMIRMPQPLDYSLLMQEGGASVLQKELAAREQSAATVMQRTGKELPVLAPDEIEQLQSLVESAPSNEVAGILSALDSLFSCKV